MHRPVPAGANGSRSGALGRLSGYCSLVERKTRRLLFWPLAALAMGCAGCSSSSNGAQLPDSGVMLGGCGTDPTRCLSGTVVTTAFSVTPTALQVELYRV